MWFSGPIASSSDWKYSCQKKKAAKKKLIFWDGHRHIALLTNCFSYLLRSMWRGIKRPARGGKWKKKERESETTRKHGVSNFFFTFCAHMKPHHFQDNLCLSIMFNFSCYEALFCWDWCFVLFLFPRRKWKTENKNTDKWIKRQQFVFPRRRETLVALSWLIQKSALLLLLFLFEMKKIIKETHKNHRILICAYLLCSHQITSEARPSRALLNRVARICD